MPEPESPPKVNPIEPSQATFQYRSSFVDLNDTDMIYQSKKAYSPVIRKQPNAQAGDAQKSIFLKQVAKTPSGRPKNRNSVDISAATAASSNFSTT